MLATVIMLIGEAEGKSSSVPKSGMSVGSYTPTSCPLGCATNGVSNFIDGSTNTEWMVGTCYDQYVIYDLGSARSLARFCSLIYCSAANPCGAFTISRCTADSTTTCTEDTTCGTDSEPCTAYYGNGGCWKYQRDCGLSGATSRHWMVTYSSGTYTAAPPACWR